MAGLSVYANHMKISTFVLIGAVALVGSFVVQDVQADPRNGGRAVSKTLVQDEPEQLVMVTGSHIPQRVRRKSIGTDSAHNVRIYTQRELLSTGRLPSVAGGLSIDPSVTISGR